MPGESSGGRPRSLLPWLIVGAVGLVALVVLLLWAPKPFTQVQHINDSIPPDNYARHGADRGWASSHVQSRPCGLTADSIKDEFDGTPIDEEKRIEPDAQWQQRINNALQLKNYARHGAIRGWANVLSWPCGLTADIIRDEFAGTPIDEKRIEPDAFYQHVVSKRAPPTSTVLYRCTVPVGGNGHVFCILATNTSAVANTPDQLRFLDSFVGMHSAFCTPVPNWSLQVSPELAVPGDCSPVPLRAAKYLGPVAFKPALDDRIHCTPTWFAAQWGAGTTNAACPRRGPNFKRVDAAITVTYQAFWQPGCVQ